jgi:hypothetical protein
MNDIAARQNAPELLELQAAKNWLYDHARRVATLQAFVAAVLPLALAAVKTLEPQLSAWLAAYVVAVLILEPELQTWQDHLRVDAARVQDLFDRTLFRLPWPHDAIGPPPAAEELRRWSLRYSSRRDRWRDWYPVEVENLPLSVARIVCQRTNGWWDTELRRRYATLLTWGAGGLGVALLVVGALRQQTVLELAVLIAVTAPALRWARSGARRQRSSAKARRRLFDWTERLSGNALSGTLPLSDLEAAARDIQRETYEQRRVSPLVPGWLYRRTRKENEDSVRAAVRLLISEYRDSQGGRG